MARTLLKQRGMSVVFWGEAVVTAVYILNLSPTKALNGRTPYEAWHGRKPAVSHLRVFGCLAFGKELGRIGKLDDRSTPGVFISYAEGSKAYRILDPGTQRVRTTAVKERMPRKRAMRHGRTRVSPRTRVGSGQDRKEGWHG
jgi:hypothetical protein